MDTPEKERVGLFVHFDFRFFPMRVHSGEGTVEWDGYRWEGIGNVLWSNSCSSSTSMTARSYNRGHTSASLPMDNKKVEELLTKDYFTERRMEWMLCTLREDGNVLERVHYNKGVIVECELRERILTFKAEDALFDSIEEKDARHKKRVDAVRKQFKREMKDAGASGGMGWLMNMITGQLITLLGLALDILKVFVFSRSRRAVRQRWQARRRVFWFRTVPAIPGMRLRKKGYKIRADMLNEASMQLYACVVGRIWDFPREFIYMLVYVNDKPLEMFNLDSLRQPDAPKGREETRDRNKSNENR